MSSLDAKPAAVTIRPIGVIHTSFPRPEGTPIQPSRAGGARGVVEIFPEFQAGLKHLEGFERIWLIYGMQLASPCRLEVVPFLDCEAHGVFATRAPARPNGIGLSCVRLAGVRGNTLEVVGVDIVDGTPLFDVKPYVPEFDAFPRSRAGWLDRSRGRRRLADGRFTRPAPGSSASAERKRKRPARGGRDLGRPSHAG